MLFSFNLAVANLLSRAPALLLSHLCLIIVVIRALDRVIAGNIPKFRLKVSPPIIIIPCSRGKNLLLIRAFYGWTSSIVSSPVGYTLFSFLSSKLNPIAVRGGLALSIVISVSNVQGVARKKEIGVGF